MGGGPITGLPPGYTVEQAQGVSTLPPGYTIEGTPPTSTPASHEQWVQQHPIADLFGFNENSDFIKKADALLGQGSQVTHEDALGALKAHVDKQTNSSAVLKKVLDFNDYLKKAGLPEAADRMTQGLSVALMAGGGGIKPPEAAPAESPVESPGLVKQIVKGEKVAREPATQAVGQAAGAAAKGAEVTPKSGAALDSFESAGNAVYSKSKGLYSQIDDATGGKFSGNQKQLENITKQMRGAGSDEELNALQAERSKLLIRQEQLFDEASGKGVDSGTVEQAKQTYRQANALHDVDAQIFQSRVVDSTDAAGRATLVDPKKLLPRLQKLDKSGRLADAFGGDEAKATKFLSDTAQIAKQGQQAARIQNIAKWLAGATGGGLIIEGVRTVGGSEK